MYFERVVVHIASTFHDATSPKKCLKIKLSIEKQVLAINQDVYMCSVGLLH